VLAVGEHLWGEVDERTQRMTSALAGGVGGCGEELCGALSGGALVIGGLYGRTSPEQDETRCGEVVCRYRDRFLEKYGTTRCHDIRETGYGSDNIWPCSVLVEGAATILLEVLAEEKEKA
jgi:C_GCAxxG_C_C family probable redox protein